MQKLHNITGLTPFQSNGMNTSDFFSRSAIYAFDLTNDNKAYERMYLKPGSFHNISFKITYSTAPAVETVALVYAEYQNTIKFDSYRNISTDY